MYLDLYSNRKGDKYIRSSLTEVNDSAVKATRPLDSSKSKQDKYLLPYVAIIHFI